MAHLLKDVEKEENTAESFETQEKKNQKENHKDERRLKMPEVNIYIETDSIFQGKTDRKCGYVLSTITRHGEKTKEGFGHFAGTYHQAVLTVAAEAIAAPDPHSAWHPPSAPARVAF